VCALLLMAGAACAGNSSTKDRGTSGDRAELGPAASVTNTTLRSTGGPATIDGPAVEPAKVVAPATYAVGSVEETYVDRSRKTSANKAAPELPERTLPTLVLYPARGAPGDRTIPNAPPAPGPWPLVVFSHGVTGTGPAYATTYRVWASAGYVVIAPSYPLSKAGAPGGPVVSDVAAQTHDIAFLIDQLLAANRATGPLEGMIDPGRIGLAGHSLGAITSLGAGYSACCVEPRVRAVAEWAGFFFKLEDDDALAPSAKGRPLLMIHGDNDGTVPYALAPPVYAKLSAPKFFVTLPGQGHVLAYVQGLGPPAGRVVTLATLDFFDHYLKGDRTGLDRMRTVVKDAGPTVATMEEDAEP